MLSLSYWYDRFRYLLLPRSLEAPVVLQFPVNDICNSQCRMCNIWKNRESDDISPARLRIGLANPLFRKVQAVGLNGGEPTLREDLAEIAEVLFEKLPALAGVSLITNGYQYERAIARITEVADVVHAHGGKLDLMVSLDGVGEMHDKVRRRPDFFARACKVIDFARDNPKIDGLRIGCTIIRDNVYGLEDLLEFCCRRGLYIKYRLGIPHQRLYTENVTEPYVLSPAEKYHVVEFLENLIQHYEKDGAQRYFYRSLIDQIVDHAPRQAGCDWQYRGATITAHGDLLYCAVQSKALGVIDRCDSEKAYFDNEDHLRWLLANKCADCQHDYVGLPGRRELLNEYVLKAVRKLNLPIALLSVLQAVVRNVRHRRHIRDYRRRNLPAIPSVAARPAGGIRRVMICGWYGTETVGDKAILGGIVAATRAALGGVHYTIVSLHPYVTAMTRSQMPELADAEIVTPEEGIRRVGQMDLLMFGGGPLMQSIEIVKIEALFAAARQLKVPTMLAGCGVGPLGGRVVNRCIAQVIRLADMRIYRDERSRAVAAALGVDTSSDLVAEDPAFTYFAVRKRLPVPRRGPGKRLLLGLRDFPYGEYASDFGTRRGLAMKVRFESAILDALRQLTAGDPDLTILPLPMCTNHFGGDDRWFYRRLFDDAKLSAQIDRSMLYRELAPEDYIAAFRGADAALCMRFHSFVFALALDVPAVAIDYTLGRGKVAALAERFRVPSVSLDAIDADTLTDLLRSQLEMPVTHATGFKPIFASELKTYLQGGLGSTA